MIITAVQDGLTVSIHWDDGISRCTETIPTQWALDLSHALNLLFRNRDAGTIPPPHELETVNDIERA